MAEFTFNFCPDTRVAEIIAPDEAAIKDFNGWDYTPAPVLPYRRRLKVTLEGLRWYLDDNGKITYHENVQTNAAALEIFYAQHRQHKPFYFEHEWLGILEVRFAAPVTVPKAIPDSGGLVSPVEINLIHHNPSYYDGY